MILNDICNSANDSNTALVSNLVIERITYGIAAIFNLMAFRPERVPAAKENRHVFVAEY